MEHSAMRVSDEEREEAVGLLNGHLFAGRITTEEHEERVGEAWSAKTNGDLDHVLRGLPPRRSPAPAPAVAAFVAPTSNSTATTSVVVGSISLALLVFTIGFTSILCLPMSAAAWYMGSEARRTSAVGHSAANTGRVLGIIGTALSLLWFAGVALLFAAIS